MKKDINITVGKNIRTYREQYGYTREKFAELLGVSAKFLYDCEVGSVGVSLSTLKRICEVLEKIEKVELSEQLSHIPPQYLDKVQELLLKQLEILALADQGTKKKTRS